MELADLVLHGLIGKALLTENRAHPTLLLLTRLEVEIEGLVREQSDRVVFVGVLAFVDWLVDWVSVLQTVSCIDL